MIWTCLTISFLGGLIPFYLEINVYFLKLYFDFKVFFFLCPFFFLRYDANLEFSNLKSTEKNPVLEPECKQHVITKLYLYIPQLNIRMVYY